MERVKALKLDSKRNLLLFIKKPFFYKKTCLFMNFNAIHVNFFIKLESL